MPQARLRPVATSKNRPLISYENRRELHLHHQLELEVVAKMDHYRYCYLLQKRCFGCKSALVKVWPANCECKSYYANGADPT